MELEVEIKARSKDREEELSSALRLYVWIASYNDYGVEKKATEKNKKQRNPNTSSNKYLGH